SYTASSGTWAIANVALNPGANTITAKAVDGSGNSATAQIIVTLNPDTTPPAVAITTPAAGFTTQATSITVSGTDSDPAPSPSGVASVTVNGAAANLDSIAGTWTVQNVPLGLGSNAITATATDNAGNTSTASITVTRNPVPPPDTTPPTVTITSPADGSQTIDSTITVTGTAIDPGPVSTGVASVTVNGVNAVYDGGSHIFTAANIALVNGDNPLSIQASDNAQPPNVSTTQIHVTRRTLSPPTLTISNPVVGATLNATSITVAGSVTAGASDVAVDVTVNGAAATVAGGQYTATVSLNSGPNTITVVATDSFGQKAQSSVSVVSETTAPTVALGTVPASVQAGNSYQITATASDSVGVAEVDFSVNGQTSATLTAPPYQFTFTVPSTAAAGQAFTISAVAKGLSGLTAVDTAQTQVSGPGGVSGYVFDDGTGYIISGASATMSEGGSVPTNASGVFSFVSASPSGLVRVFNAGYTPVERAYSVGSGLGTSVFDSRLTLLDGQTNVIHSSGGLASGSGGVITATFAAGSFPDGSDVRLTSISQQGLINLLPFGWSPVPGAVVDVRVNGPDAPATTLFSSAAQLNIASVAGLVSSTPLVLVHYDESAHAWIVLQTGVAAGTGGALSATLPGPGQYAFLVADTGATAPPAAAPGNPLPAGPSADSSALDSATAVAVANPASAVFSTTAQSAITVTATAQSQLPSGVSVEVTFEETYNLFTQADPLLVDRPAEDFVMYAYPAASGSTPNNLAAQFIAKPTQTQFSLAQLKTANVHMIIQSGRAANTGVLIGANGGSVATSDGSELDVPAGALTQDTPAFINTVSPDAITLNMPSGYEVVGALDVDMSGAVLSSGGALSIPAVSGDTSHIVVAQLLTAGGERSPKAVARAVVKSGKLTSSTAPPDVPTGVTLPGITVGGRYVFIRIPSTFG
ncbi:MAG: beta strand repeat-containing protein, partial [Blastocatellia bacterium]